MLILVNPHCCLFLSASGRGRYSRKLKPSKRRLKVKLRLRGERTRERARESKRDREKLNKDGDEGSKGLMREKDQRHHATSWSERILSI